MRQLPKKAVFAKFSGLLIFAVVGVVLGIIWFLLEVFIPRPEMTPLFPLGGVIVCSLILGYCIAWIWLFRYSLKEAELSIEKGVISKSYDAILYSRIQNVNITRNIFERILGMSTVRIETAGSNAGTEAVIPGVGADTAEDIRVKISEQVHSNN